MTKVRSSDDTMGDIENLHHHVILVIEDEQETRDGLEKLLSADGYEATPARDEKDAMLRANHTDPHLILLGLGQRSADVIAFARRIRDRICKSDQIPVVIFCVQTIAEGAEVSVGANIYLTRPDNFDQLRHFLHRLLHKPLAVS